MIEQREYEAFRVFPAVAGTVSPIRPIDVTTGHARVTLQGTGFSVRIQISNAQPGKGDQPHLFLPPDASFETFQTVTPDDPPTMIPAPVRWLRLIVDAGVITGGNVAESSRTGAEINERLLVDIAQSTELMQRAAGVGRVATEADLTGRPGTPEKPVAYELIATNEHVLWNGTGIVPGSRGPSLAAAQPLQYADVAVMLASHSPASRHWAGGRAGGMFDLLPVGDTTPVDGGVTLQRADGRKLQRANVTVVKAHWFGMKDDGVTDNSPALQLALDFAKRISAGYVQIEPGRRPYRLDGQCTVWAGIGLLGMTVLPQQQAALNLLPEGGTQLNLTNPGLSPFRTEKRDNDNPAGYKYAAGGGSFISGFTLFYPNQDPLDIRPYAPFLQFDLNSYDVALTNIYNINTYALLDATSPHGRLTMSDIGGTVLSRLVQADWGMDCDKFLRIHLSPAWMFNGTAAQAAAVRQYIDNHFIMFDFWSLDDFVVDQCSVYGGWRGMSFNRVGSKWASNPGYSRYSDNGKTGSEKAVTTISSSYGLIGTAMFDGQTDAPVDIRSVQANGIRFGNLHACSVGSNPVVRISGMDRDSDTIGLIDINGSLWGGLSPLIIANSKCRVRYAGSIMWTNLPGSAGVVIDGDSDVELWLPGTTFATMGGNADNDPPPTEISFLLSDAGKARVYADNLSPANRRTSTRTYSNGKGQARVKLNGRWNERYATATPSNYQDFLNDTDDMQTATLRYTTTGFASGGFLKLYGELLAPGASEWSPESVVSHSADGDHIARMSVPAGYLWRWIVSDNSKINWIGQTVVS